LLGENYSDELKQTMSLEKNVHADMPPIFLLHCIGDKKVSYRNSVIFDNALTENKVEHEFLLFDEYRYGGHGFGIQPNGKATGWIDKSLRWVESIK
jgi:dipeptidyl aminopeptidase/acylaminoacyl peptidase